MYKELKPQEGEVVERFNWIKSTQTNFIKSIILSTNYDCDLCVRGEIEVHDILKLEPEKRPKFDNDVDYDSDNYKSNTFIWEELDDTHSTVFEKKPLVFRSILLYRKLNFCSNLESICGNWANKHLLVN